ncbi:Sec-independent protein translocase protein TatB [Komagataeibacter sp. FNDCR2]|uniref:Sec-independent protein translocase protein TatB n=1 Tax=Komagataeibacter sp. FNDCR2 TaxID=2878682 RepID=UPI001E57CC5F|nr:Sec-independent protein translocase protein TatB [Komagataeibacter sp. FNDCR2]MCE2576317.1 Sec-independent protein translocase protein TatB [Komagataeibacter sp. FNDCR2]
MFDFAWSEFALVGVVGLLLIGPKDMPVAIRTVTGLIRKARGLATEFQSHVDEMVREADLTEARDQLGQLRRLNVRDKIMKAIDGDGTLRRTLDERPLAPVVTPPPGPPATDMPERTLPPLHHIPPLMDMAQDVADAGERVDAPDFLPPRTARRIAAEMPHLSPPAFLPPVRVIHAGRRISVAAGGQDQ